MLRECTNNDLELVAEYLQEEHYGRAILTALNEFGLDKMFQTVYINVENMGDSGVKLTGVYLFLHRSLLLYCKENQVDIDFLEEKMGIAAPEKVAGRRDNVNIVSWLLTDYHMDTVQGLPDIADAEGGMVECLNRAEHEGEWTVLTR